jgi:hypothetical protein
MLKLILKETETEKDYDISHDLLPIKLCWHITYIFLSVGQTVTIAWDSALHILEEEMRFPPSSPLCCGSTVCQAPSLIALRFELTGY